MKKSYHGGEFFQAIGEDFSTLERAEHVINADVLDAWFDPSPRVLEKLITYLPFIARTSPPNYSEGLIATISQTRGIPANTIVAGGGSSDLIFALFHSLVKSGDRVLLLDPTYGEYSFIANVVGAEIQRFMLDKHNDHGVDIEALVRYAREAKPQIVVIVNPNSPTGKHIERDVLKQCLQQIPLSTTVVVDETYVEYAGNTASIESYAVSAPNVVVVKSMSKVYSLSGLRVGYLVAHPSLVDRISDFIPPWAVSFPAQVAAVEALNDEQYYRQRYAETHMLREAFISDLQPIPGLTIYPSIANFFLVECALPLSAAFLCDELKKQQIYIRNVDTMSSQFDGLFVRIAVKNESANRRMATALKEICR